MEASTVVKVDTEIVDASQKCWEDFDIAEGILSNIIRLGWTQPTSIQSVALRSMKRNIVAQVKNNISTTSAFRIASLMCAVPNLQALQIICLATIRDLNRHNFAGFQELASATPIRVGIAEANYTNYHSAVCFAQPPDHFRMVLN
jgi:superfamily II DNA/RNA helicase